MWGCTPSSELSNTNALINETSPYLLQHAKNPVNWYPWGDEALKKAADENKLLVVSIGYAACHWCHVMEHESFEDSTVAALMNEHFVSIKVDREERPDIDHIYMNASQLLTGRGGWPLNAVALPDGRPFFTGTYLPKDQWMQVLQKLVETYEEDPERLTTIANQVTEGIRTIDQLDEVTVPTKYTNETLNQLFQVWKPQLDFDWGGNRGAPKFPMPVNLNFLLQYHYYSGDSSARNAVLTTLDKMALGGIYDHLGGGFARYATDAKWKIPHFEKMLYDNAQLVSLYSKAYQLTGDSLYRDVVYETLDFVDREMTAPTGGFYSSLDADSEGEEGKFYVWAQDEIADALDNNAETFATYYNITDQGNWQEGKNILYATQRIADFADEQGVSPQKIEDQLHRAKSELFAYRSERTRPGLDNKVLTAWNGLMLTGLIDAYRTFDEPHFLQMARNNANFLKDQIIQADYSVTRSYKDGTSSIPGFLDDYAFLISAYINLYQATFEERWLYTAESLTKYVMEHFQDDETSLFFYTHNQHASLIVRQKEISDNVIPSANSVMAKNVWILGQLLANDTFTKQAQSMVDGVYPRITAHPTFYAQWASLLSSLIHTPYEVAILGEMSMNLRQQMDKHYLPDVLFLGGKSEGSLALLENKLVQGQTTIYVCQNKVCKLPVTHPAAALAQIN